MAHDDSATRPPAPERDEESLDVWGFRDSRFEVGADGVVTMTGDRYELSGRHMPYLLPWMSQVLKTQIDPLDLNVSGYPRPVPSPVKNTAFAEEIGAFLQPDQVADADVVRLRHGHGHNQEEMYTIKYGDPVRVPDLVVSPADEEQVVRIVAAAARHGVCLIPFGGGTNVSGALQCRPDEERMIVSVDMRRMNRIIAIDPVNRMAHIEAGASGRQIAQQLAREGFTIGHEPDSFEFSTLGGWVATHASGMKKNRYGNIENLLLDMRVVTPTGMLERSGISPRESIGLDPRRFMLGSEGGLGIVTSAVLKIFRLPAVQHYGSLVFPSFKAGVEFMYDLAQRGNPPASVRLVDNLQFQFNQALKARPTGLHAVKSKLERFLVERVKRFDLKEVSACTLLFEGDAADVAAQEKDVYRIGAKHGGLKGGSENGRRGYAMTFAIAYIRDFALDHFILSESFETSVPWSRLVELCDNVKRRVGEEHRRHGLPGDPFISCRVTQLYDTGACVYFYLGFYCKGVADPSEMFAEIERAARAEILASGGSLSHHHGIGKLRQPFLEQIMSPTSLDWIRRSKRALDPDDVFGVGNHALGPPS